MYLRIVGQTTQVYGSSGDMVLYWHTDGFLLLIYRRPVINRCFHLHKGT